MLDIETEERYLRDPAVFKQEILALGDDIHDVLVLPWQEALQHYFVGLR